MKTIGNVETDKFSLEVIECDCGFHLGIDSTFLEQVGSVQIKCPSCNKLIQVEDYDSPEK